MVRSAATLGVIDHFLTLADPRQVWKVVYPLPEIMLTILSATLASADDYLCSAKLEAATFGRAVRVCTFRGPKFDAD